MTFKTRWQIIRTTTVFLFQSFSKSYDHDPSSGGSGFSLNKGEGDVCMSPYTLIYCDLKSQNALGQKGP